MEITTRRLASIIVFGLIVLSSLFMPVTFAKNSFTLGSIVKVGINELEEKISGISINDIKVIDEISLSDFGGVGHTNTDGKTYTYATTTFSIMFLDKNPTDIIISIKKSCVTKSYSCC